MYEMLRAWPPFCRWGLPPACEVKFHVSRTRAHDAYWWIVGRTRHQIEVSETRHAHLSSLIESVAHEMIHVRQRCAHTETRGEHNAEFKRLARRVCDLYGFDYGQFLG